MYDLGNCLYVHNLYVDSWNRSIDVICELEAARDEILRAIHSFDTNFVIDGVNADKNAIPEICERINNQINRIRGLQNLYDKCMNDMKSEAAAHGDAIG